MLAGLLLLLLGTAVAHAGLKLKDADGNEKIDLGFRLQVLGISTDRDLDGDGKFETYDDFRIRRARFRLKGTVTEHFGMFFQTDVSGNDIQMIDAYIHLKKDAKLQAFLGQHLPPSNRQNVTSSGTLLAADRPNIIYKTLTWGGRALQAFSTATRGDTDSGLRGTAQVRDTGVTLFGVNDMGTNTHFKYHLGYYDGISAPGQDSERTTGRIQFNFGDPEPSYYSVATYLGGKDTLAIGASYDTQSDVGNATFQADYTASSFDIFAEKPVGEGSLTFEAAFLDLDLDGRAPRVEGDGFYVQAGYLIRKEKWQPWFLYEEWNSNDPTGRGSGDAFRVGVSYFIAGHNANFKIGYESLSTDTNIGSSDENGVDTFLVGFYTTY
jgi:hypothetical protein